MNAEQKLLELGVTSEMIESRINRFENSRMRMLFPHFKADDARQFVITAMLEERKAN